MSAEILFVLALHSAAGAIFLILAFRDGLGSTASLKWGAIGFVSGVVGLIARARMDRRHVNYMQILQDTCLNLMLELIALYGLPHLLG
jgi:hypothetical protein